MKKIIRIFLFAFIMLSGSNAFAERQATINTLKNVTVSIKFNVRTKSEIDNTILYVPIRVVFTAIATGDNVVGNGVSLADFGTPTNTPKTVKEIYQLLPAPFKPLYKNAIINAVGDDISE
ncbi:MAG TPA: hypothetical protein ENH82_00410 [bacterium]|nr:hypothetical protein [bacterium]